MPPPSKADAVTSTKILPGVERTTLAKWEKALWPSDIFPGDFFSSSSSFSAWTKKGQSPFLRAAMRRQSSARKAVKKVAWAEQAMDQVSGQKIRERACVIFYAPQTNTKNCGHLHYNHSFVMRANLQKTYKYHDFGLEISILGTISW